MVKFFLSLTFAFSLFADCNAQNQTESTNWYKFDSKIENFKVWFPIKPNEIVKEINVVELGYVDSYEKLPKLKFEKTSKAEFDKYQSETSYIVPNIKQNKDRFYLQTRKQRHTFKKIRYPASNGATGSEFLGFYPNLKLFAISDISVAESLDFATLVLLDSETDYKYKIISIGDGRVELPIVSKNKKYLVYYYNYDYQHKNSFIGVLKIGEKSNPKKFLQEQTSFQSNQFAIEKIIWIDDKSLIVEGFEKVFENQKWIKKYDYYKTNLQ